MALNEKSDYQSYYHLSWRGHQGKLNLVNSVNGSNKESCSGQLIDDRQEKKNTCTSKNSEQITIKNSQTSITKCSKKYEDF